MIEKKVSKEIFLDIKNNVKSEGVSIDFKECFKFGNKKEKLELIKDIMAFANTNGGYIIYGVEDEIDKFKYVGLDERSDIAKLENIQDFAENYYSEQIDFVVAAHEIDQEEYYMLYIEKHNGTELVSFKKDGEYERKKRNNTQSKVSVFKKMEQYGRKGCRNSIVNLDKQFKKMRNSENMIISNINKIEAPYESYVDRDDTLEKFLKLINNNISCIQINGLGGIGKTSFIYNFCERILENSLKINNFNPMYIIWITGKLTLFKPTGIIETIKKSEISYDEFIDEIQSVLELDIEDKSVSEKNELIWQSLEEYPSLFVVDNMETIFDKDIIDFLLHIPKNSKVILTTRQDMEELTYQRINLSGFTKTQFNKYYHKQFNCFDSREEISDATKKEYEADIFEKTQGSPIITNMIIYKICNGSNIPLLLKQLNNMESEDSYYDKAMEFCFKDTFSQLSQREREIMYILSTPDTNDVGFDLRDLTYILDERYSNTNMDEAVSKLHKLSFCNKKNEEYITPTLVKLFANRELSKDATIDTDAIGKKLKEFYAKKESYSLKAIQYYERAHAFTFKEKEIAERVRELLADFDIEQDYPTFDKKYKNIFKEMPDYAFPYFKRAMLEKSLESDVAIVSDYFSKAVKRNPNEVHYWTEYAFYEERYGRREYAKKYFENALKIDPKNISANHGYAICLKKMYSQKSEYTTKKDKILNHFQKAYSPNETRYDNNHNVKNAHAHASYLLNIGLYQDAYQICHRGLEYNKTNTALKSLLGSIEKKIDPNFIGETKINNTRKGVFEALSHEDTIKLITMVKNQK